MITLNEAHNMEAVLNNISGWAQEVFIVDSYSTDATIDIALKHGVHVVQRAFRGFGDQWNFALKSLPISAPWTMKLDPDERLTPELKANIQTIIERDDNDAISMRRRLWFMGRPLYVRQELVRVWRTGSCTFTDVLVNEHPLVQGRIVKVVGDLEHHDSPNLHHWVEKQNNYSTVEALAAYQKYKLAADPKLFGTNLEKRMWLKENFWHLPFRYAIMFLYAFIVLGAWRAGRVGFAWAWLRAELYRMREFKLNEMRIIGDSYGVPPSQNGKPDPRVPQYESPEQDISDHTGGVFYKGFPGKKAGGIEYHDRLAEGWDQRYHKGGFLRRANFFIDKIVPSLNIHGHWLDAGCGSGYFARLLCDRGANVQGIDGSTEMIRVARRLSIPSYAPPRLLLKTVETVEHLSYPTASFDGIICLSVLEYLDNPEQCFEELVRVLRPGGQLVISVPNRHSFVRQFQRAVTVGIRNVQKSYLNVSTHSWTADELKNMADKLPLRDVTITSFDPIISTSWFGVIPPSLFYLVARKIEKSAT